MWYSVGDTLNIYIAITIAIELPSVLNQIFDLENKGQGLGRFWINLTG